MKRGRAAPSSTDDEYWLGHRQVLCLGLHYSSPFILWRTVPSNLRAAVGVEGGLRGQIPAKGADPLVAERPEPLSLLRQRRALEPAFDTGSVERVYDHGGTAGDFRGRPRAGGYHRRAAGHGLDD